MRESCSYGSVGVRGGNEPLYPELLIWAYLSYNKQSIQLVYVRQFGSGGYSPPIPSSGVSISRLTNFFKHLTSSCGALEGMA